MTVDPETALAGKYWHLFVWKFGDNLSTAAYHDAESSAALTQQATDHIRKTNRNSYAGSEHATNSPFLLHVMEKEVSKVS